MNGEPSRARAALPEE